jgi:hypothetical protein
MSDRTAYLAAEGYVDELAYELGAVDREHGRLLIAEGPPRPVAWAANVWLDPQEIKIASISDAATQLRAIQRNWALYAPKLYRRATLIQEQLPSVSSKPLVFGAPTPLHRSARGPCSMPKQFWLRQAARAPFLMAKSSSSKTAAGRQAALI